MLRLVYEQRKVCDVVLLIMTEDGHLEKNC